MQKNGFGVLKNLITQSLYYGEWLGDVFQDGYALHTCGLKQKGQTKIIGITSNGFMSRSLYLSNIYNRVFQYKGQTIELCANGFGIASYQISNNQTEEYFGEFKGDQRSGCGQLTFQSQSTYIGEWIGDLCHGIGQYKDTRAGKSTYTGQFKNHKRDGFGVQIYSNKQQYIGEWKNDLRNGIGIMTCKDGKNVLGIYENGKQIRLKYILK